MTAAFRTLCLLLGAALTACGGGGGAGHTITGVAASGAAIAQGTVEVKCQVGSGSTTTGLDGSYSLTIPGGQGPCLLRATDPVTKTVFHSALEKDAAAMVAHITPLSDLVVARALGAEPAAAFLNPGAQFEKITPANLAAGIEAAQQAVVVVGSALDVDPLKGQLKTATAEAQGTVLDRAIDAIMATLAAADKALSQLAAALANNTVAVSDSVTNLVDTSSTFLTGCPAARSGLVWLIDSFSGSAPVAHEINFSTSGAGARTLKRLSDNTSQAITTGGVSCSFVTADAREFRISDNGIGIWQSASGFGVLVPIQPSTSLTADSLTGQYGAMGYLKGTYFYVNTPVDFTKALPLEFLINAPGKPLIQGRRCDITSGSSGLPKRRQRWREQLHCPSDRLQGRRQRHRVPVRRKIPDTRSAIHRRGHHHAGHGKGPDGAEQGRGRCPLAPSQPHRGRRFLGSRLCPVRTGQPIFQTQCGRQRDRAHCRPEQVLPKHPRRRDLYPPARQSDQRPDLVAHRRGGLHVPSGLAGRLVFCRRESGLSGTVQRRSRHLGRHVSSERPN